MSDDADDVDADGADDNVGDSDGVFFSLARRTEHATAGPPPEASGATARHVHQATPSPWVPGECPLASLVVVQAFGVSPQHRPRRLGFAVPLPRHKDRLSKVQGVQEVAGTQLAPVIKKLRQRDVVASPDTPRPVLARGRAALTLEKCGLAPQLMNWMRRRGTSIDTLINHCPF